MFLSQCSTDSIKAAAQSLVAGHLVAFPTETVYGLGADALNKQAVARIYQVKGRPADHPLIVHIHSMQVMGQWVEDVPEYAISLGRDFWPGPMTLILKRQELARDFVTGSQDSVGIRVPSEPIALELLARFESLGGLGVAAPSANRFGRVSPTSAQYVQDEIGENLVYGDLIIEGGNSKVGIESTIIDCRNDTTTILRPGAITQAMIEEAAGLKVSEINNSDIRVSGSLEKHYAPNAQILLDIQATEGQGFIAPADVATPSGAIRLASPQTTDEYARVLYSALRDGDAQGLETIAIIQPSGDGLAIAIRDRLMRASKGR